MTFSTIYIRERQKPIHWHIKDFLFRFQAFPASEKVKSFSEWEPIPIENGWGYPSVNYTAQTTYLTTVRQNYWTLSFIGGRVLFYGLKMRYFPPIFFSFETWKCQNGPFVRSLLQIAILMVDIKDEKHSVNIVLESEHQWFTELIRVRKWIQWMNRQISF